MLWPTLIGLFVIFLLSVAAFVFFMDWDYLRTFVTTTTGPEQAADEFRKATTDEQKVSYCKTHLTYCESFSDELEALVKENWADWMANRPVWLTDTVIGTIADKYIPKAAVDILKVEGGGKRRRSSAFGKEV